MVNIMDSSTSTTKVSKCVARKINHYLNKERVESEYDPSGKGIHTTHPLMANYELAYLVTTEDDNMKSLLTEKDQCSEGEMLVLPCLVPSAQCKSHVRRSDARRVTDSARQVINSVPVKEIDMIRRYRPACRTTDTLETGKVSQMSRSVHAMLNTKEAVDFAVKHDKKTKRVRAKTAHQLRRTSRGAAANEEKTGRSTSNDQRRTISSATPTRKKKLKEKYTVLPFGPGNSSHIATWLSEQKDKDIKALKKKEKKKKRAEKEAMIEKERKDKEEIVTAMESLHTDDEKTCDKDVRKNEKKRTDELNERITDRKRKNRKHKENKRKENDKDELSSHNSSSSRHSSSSRPSTTKSEDQPDVPKHSEEKPVKRKNKEEERIDNMVDAKHRNDNIYSYEGTDTKDESEPITDSVSNERPIRDDLTNGQSNNKSQEQNVKYSRKKEDDEKETVSTKASDEITTDKKSEKGDSRDIDEIKTRSVRTVEYVRSESVVSLPRS